MDDAISFLDKMMRKLLLEMTIDDIAEVMALQGREETLMQVRELAPERLQDFMVVQWH